MLALLADLYSPLLAFFCIYYLRFVMNKRFMATFIAAYCYVYSFAFIEYHFGWWATMGADFSSHTAAVMVMVFALLSVNLKIGGYAFTSVLLYGALMNLLHYHSWFDVITTMFICVPCWLLFRLAQHKKNEEPSTSPK